MPQRCHVRAEIEHRRGELAALVAHGEFWEPGVALVAMRVAEILAQPRDVVQLVAGYVVQPSQSRAFSVNQ